MRTIPTSQDNPCLLCGNVKPNCRGVFDSPALFCHTFADARRGEKINGYVCTKEMGAGHTATFMPDNSQEWDDSRREQWQQERKRRSELSKLALEQKIAGQLSAVERDVEYRKILAQLKLSQSDRTSLKNRGLSDAEIDKSLYRSVVTWQKVSGKFPANLPGLLRGDTLNVARAGIICPVFNLVGLIVALRVRKSEVENGLGRYFWLTSKTNKKPDGHTAHLDGELPLAFFNGDSSSGLAYVAEGNEFKPWILNLRTNSMVLGSARNWYKSPKQSETVIAYLKSAGVIKIVLCPDAGDISNRVVFPGWIKEAEFFQSQGFQVVFEWHGQTDKETGKDIDELENYSDLHFISLEYFQFLLNEQKNSQQQDLEDHNWKLWVKSLLFKAINKLDQEKFTFPDIPKENAIIAVKSGLGTGKTEAMLREIARTKLGIRLLGYRNNLLFQTIERSGDFSVKITHINEDGVSDEANTIHMSCCVNSMYKLDGMFDDHDIYIDETVSVLLHVIDGGTFDYAGQGRALKMLEQAVLKARRVVLLDGNLTDDVVDFIASLAPEKKVIKIENTRKIPPHKIMFCDGIIVEDEGDERKVTLKPRAKSHLYSFLLDDEVIPFIASDSKKLAHELGELLTKNGKTGIVISQDTVGEPWAKEFLKNPNKYIESKKPQFVIITPSCESGMSITLKYFTHKFSFFCGVLGTSSQHQIMFRLRDNTITHYVFCPQRTQIRDSTIPKQYTPQAIMDTINESVTLSALMALDLANDQESAGSIIAKAFEKAAKDDKWFKLAAKFWALANNEKQNLRKCLIHSLKEAGHDVSEIQMEIVESLDKQISEIKGELLDREVEALYRAVPYETADEAKKLAKSEHNKDTAIRIKKTLMLKERLPDIDQQPGYGKKFWVNHLNDRNYVSGHQNFARLLESQAMQKRYEADWFFRSTSEYFFVWGMKNTHSARLKVLHQLNALDLVNLDKEYCKESPELTRLLEFFRKDKKIQIVTGIIPPKETQSGKEIIEFFRQIMQYIGVKLTKPKKKVYQPTNTRLSFYKIDVEQFNDPLRLAIIETTRAKDREWLASDKAKIDWSIAHSIDESANELAERYKLAKEYRDFLIAESEWKNKKYTDSMLVEYMVEENAKIDKIIQLAWEKLTPQERTRVINLQVVPNNPLTILDSRIVGKTNFSTDHFNSLPKVTLWKLRLTEVLNMGCDTAKLVYRQVPNQILNAVWVSLDVEVQQRYLEMFPPQPQVKVEVKTEPEVQAQQAASNIQSCKVVSEVKTEPQPQVKAEVKTEPELQTQQAVSNTQTCKAVSEVKTEPEPQAQPQLPQQTSVDNNIKNETSEESLAQSIIVMLRTTKGDSTEIKNIIHQNGLPLIKHLEMLLKPNSPLATSDWSNLLLFMRINEYIVGN